MIFWDFFPSYIRFLDLVYLLEIGISMCLSRGEKTHEIMQEFPQKKKKVTTSKTNGTVAEELCTVASQIFFLTKESLESG